MEGKEITVNVYYLIVADVYILDELLRINSRNTIYF